MDKCIITIYVTQPKTKCICLNNIRGKHSNNLSNQLLNKLDFIHNTNVYFPIRGVELDGLPFCQECQERFASPNAYRRHMKTVHKQIRTTNLDSYAESKAIEPTKVMKDVTNLNKSFEFNVKIYIRSEIRFVVLNV